MDKERNIETEVERRIKATEAIETQTKEFLSIGYYDIAKENKTKAESSKLPWEEQKHSIISIIFSALTLEASINDISIEYLDTDTFNDIEGLSLPAKWRTATRLLLKKGENFGKFNELYEDLKKLQKLRSDLVHYKSKFYKPNKLDKILNKRINKKEANKYFQLIRKVLETFCKLTGIERIPVLRKIVIEEESNKILRISRRTVPLKSKYSSSPS